MLAENIIDPSQTKWAALILFVLKIDETIRFRVKYRNLYAVTNRFLSLILHWDNRVDSLGKATVFLKIYASSGYWKIKIKNETDKNYFTSLHGLYRSIRMPFGLSKAFRTFQRTMNVIIWSIKWYLALFLSEWHLDI